MEAKLVTPGFTHLVMGKHERLPKKVMSAASRMVSYIPGSAAPPPRVASLGRHLIEADPAAETLSMFSDLGPAVLLQPSRVGPCLHDILVNLL